MWSARQVVCYLDRKCSYKSVVTQISHSAGLTTRRKLRIKKYGNDSFSVEHREPSINYVTRISWFFNPPPLGSCHRWSHFWDLPPIVTSHILQFHLLNSRRLTKFLHVYELARHRIALSEHWMSLRVCCLSCSMLNACQWNFFHSVDTYNIALIPFLKCDVAKFRILPTPSCHTMLHFDLLRPPPLNVWLILWMPP